MSCPSKFDPSAPGVSKQMMLDWMHIHHPKTPIRAKIGPVGLAQLVRSVQPTYFPDAASDAPACATRSTSSIDAPIVTEDQSTATTTEIRSSTATSGYPKLDSLQDLQNLKTLIPPTPPFFKLNTASRHAKRAPSFEVKQSLNCTELGLDVCDTSPKISKRKKIAHLSRTVIKPTNSTGAAIQGSTHPSAPGHSIPNTTLTFDDDEKDLKDLHNSLAMPALPLQNAVTKLNVSKRNVIKRPPVSDQTQHQSISQKPSDSESNQIEDLIDFSDTHCMDIGNPALGKDIPPIFPTIVSGTKRSGVDVFKEERQREERICQLESSIAQVLEEIGQLSADVLQAKMQLEDQAHKIQMLETDKDFLKKTAQVTSILNPKLTHLESRVETLQRRFDVDHEEIVTHGQILEKLMASDNDDDESCD